LLLFAQVDSKHAVNLALAFPKIKRARHNRPITMAASRNTASQDIVDKLRLTCLDLPEAYEESAWVGTRWMVAKKNFAHVLMIDAGWPPAYAKAAGCDGPACVLTFRAPRPALDALRFARYPFFRPVWFQNIVGMFIDAKTDWDDVSAMLVASYCVLAPRKLVELVERR
jgi:hypothetical protein